MHCKAAVPRKVFPCAARLIFGCLVLFFMAARGTTCGAAALTAARTAAAGLTGPLILYKPGGCGHNGRQHGSPDQKRPPVFR